MQQPRAGYARQLHGNLNLGNQLQIPVRFSKMHEDLHMDMENSSGFDELHKSQSQQQQSVNVPHNRLPSDVSDDYLQPVSNKNAFSRFVALQNPSNNQKQELLAMLERLQSSSPKKKLLNLTPATAKITELAAITEGGIIKNQLNTSNTLRRFQEITQEKTESNNIYNNNTAGYPNQGSEKILPSRPAQNLHSLLGKKSSSQMGQRKNNKPQDISNMTQLFQPVIHSSGHKFKRYFSNHQNSDTTSKNIKINNENGFIFSNALIQARVVSSSPKISYDRDIKEDKLIQTGKNDITSQSKRNLINDSNQDKELMQQKGGLNRSNKMTSSEAHGISQSCDLISKIQKSKQKVKKIPPLNLNQHDNLNGQAGQMSILLTSRYVHQKDSGFPSKDSLIVDTLQSTSRNRNKKQQEYYQQQIDSKDNMKQSFLDKKTQQINQILINQPFSHRNNVVMHSKQLNFEGSPKNYKRTYQNTDLSRRINSFRMPMGSPNHGKVQKISSPDNPSSQSSFKLESSPVKAVSNIFKDFGGNENDKGESIKVIQDLTRKEVSQVEQNNISNRGIGTQPQNSLEELLTDQINKDQNLRQGEQDQRQSEYCPQNELPSDGKHQEIDQKIELISQVYDEFKRFLPGSDSSLPTLNELGHTDSSMIQEQLQKASSFQANNDSKNIEINYNNNNNLSFKDQSKIPAKLNLAIFREYMPSPHRVLQPSKQGQVVVYSARNRTGVAQKNMSMSSNRNKSDGRGGFRSNMLNEEERVSKVAELIQQQIKKVDEKNDRNSKINSYYRNVNSSFSSRQSNKDLSYFRRSYYSPSRQTSYYQDSQSSSPPSSSNFLQVPFPSKTNETEKDQATSQKIRNLNSGVQGKHIDFSPRQFPDGSRKYTNQEIALASEKAFLHYLETTQGRKNFSISSMQIRPKYQQNLQQEEYSQPAGAEFATKQHKLLQKQANPTESEMIVTQTAPCSMNDGLNLEGEDKDSEKDNTPIFKVTKNSFSQQCSLGGILGGSKSVKNCVLGMLERETQYIPKNADPDRNLKILKKLFSKTAATSSGNTCNNSVNPFQNFSNPRTIIFSRTQQQPKKN